MNKPKILILNASTIYGGGEYFVLKLAGGLQKTGYKIIAGCKKGSVLSEKLAGTNINTVEIDFPENGSSGLIRNARHIKKIINENKIDIVHSNTGYDRTAAAFSIRGTNTKHVTSCHSLESLSHNLTHYIRNKFLTHHFIADGESIKKLIVTENNIPANKVTVVHNGIDAGEMKRDHVLRKKIRDKFGVAENEILIGSVGRLVEFKGYKYLLTALKIIHEKIPNIKLMLVGDGELMPQLKEQADTLKLSDNVIFTGFRDDMQAVYSAFDIYANSSIEGGGELFPFTILYAMAQGIPVAAASVGDIPSMLEDNVSGFLAEEKSPFRIAEKVISLAENREKAVKMGLEAAKKLNTEFTLEKMLTKICNIYEIVQKPAKNK